VFINAGLLSVWSVSEVEVIQVEENVLKENKLSRHCDWFIYLKSYLLFNFFAAQSQLHSAALVVVVWLSVCHVRALCQNG